LNKTLYILILTVLFSLGATAQVKILTGESAKYIRFYPNPAVSSINFEFQKDYNRSFSLQIYNFIGKKVMDVATVTPKLNVPLTDFYRGVYIYQLRDRTGNIVESGRFQVIK